MLKSTLILLMMLLSWKIHAQTLSAADQERVVIMQNAVKLKLPVKDLEAMFKNAFAMNKTEISLAALDALTQLPDHPTLIPIMHDMVERVTDCRITMKTVSTIAAMRDISTSETQTLANNTLRALAKNNTLLPCIKNNPNQSDALSTEITKALSNQ